MVPCPDCRRRIDIDSRSLAHRLTQLLAGDGRSEAERAQLVRLMTLLAELGPPPDPDGDFPDYGHLRDRFRAACNAGDGDLLEEYFLELYCHLHMHAAPCTPAERKVVDASGGTWCHAGGLSPLLKAAPFIHDLTVSVDLGAGNGLQGLLLQRLYPHRRTVQIEISSRMVEIGQRLQAWLEVPPERVKWVVANVAEVSIAGFDFIYLYRPLRPEGPGRAFYQRMAHHLEVARRPVVIFSIADCLHEFLSARFERFYHDGQLSCFRGPLSIGGRVPAATD